METTIEVTPPSPELVTLVKKATGLHETIVEDLMRYNVMTMNQVAAVTGKSLSAVNQLIRPRLKKNEQYTVLTAVYPFPEIILETGERDMGRIMVLRDEKFYAYLQKELK